MLSPYDIAFVVEVIRTSEGGEKLSQEALSLIVVLTHDALLPYCLIPRREKSGFDILLDAHDHIWKDKSQSLEDRLEACNLLFEMAYKIWSDEKEQQKW